MRRELILSVAYQKFSEKGYNASLSEIAKDSGIKKQTLYNYYENKDDLFFEMIKIEATQHFNEIIEQYKHLETADSKMNLEHIFMLNMKYFSEDSKYRFWRWLIAIDSEQLRLKCDVLTNTFKKSFLVLLADIFNAGIKEGVIRQQPIEALTHTYIVLVHGALISLVFYESLIDAETMISNVWETFWNGISSK